MMDKIISFFESVGLYDKNYFDYLYQNSLIVDKPYSDIKDLVGCFITKDGCKLVLPKIQSIYDELIYVHEITHALFLEDDSEIFPNIMESIYINKYVSDEKLKKEIIDNTKNEINNNVDNNHIIGKKIKLLKISKINDYYI